jgi:hypothetical protein
MGNYSSAIILQRCNGVGGRPVEKLGWREHNILRVLESREVLTYQLPREIGQKP